MVLDERSVVGTILDSGWVDGNGARKTPIAWPNREYIPPEDSPWIRVSLLPGTAFRLTIGGDTNITRHPGILSIQLFDTYGKGDHTIRSLADDLMALFRDLVTPGSTGEQIRFQSPSLYESGVDGGWYQMNCSIPFLRDTLF